MNYNLILGYLILTIHILFIIFIVFIPFFTNNIYILLIIIYFDVILLTQWYLLDSCFFDNIENYLFKKKLVYKNGKDKSIIVYYIEKIIGERASFLFFSLMPVIISTYCVLKIINNLKYNKLK